MKLDNLLLNQNANVDVNLKDNENFFQTNKINIIDFGFATRYKEKITGELISKKSLPTFKGNAAFASLNQMKFRSTCRRDDLISLFYLMTYMLHDGKMPGYNVYGLAE